MLGKKFIHSRGVMIAIAVVALMTLTAGVAAAASAKAKNIEVDGGVGLVTLDIGSTVQTKFKTDKQTGDIKSVEIKTDGELIFGQLGLVDLGVCKEKGKHSAGACLSANAALSGAGVSSSHKSTAKLSVVYQDAGVLVGTLKGSLKADLTVSSQTGDVMTGHAKLKIASSGAPSTYVCILGVDPAGNPVPAPIQACQDAKGKQELGIYVVIPGLGPVYLDPVSHLPDPSSKAGPILVPYDLHVIDTGTFSVESPSVKIKGKIAVSVDTAAPGTQQGVISITKGEATFAVDEPEDKPKKDKKDKKPKKGHDDDDDDDHDDD